MSSGPSPISPSSEEYLRIQYLLQLSQQNHQIKDLNIWAFGNPMLTVQFEKRASGLLTLDSWVDISSLDDKLNSVENILNRGFQFPPGRQGKRFTIGNIKKPSSYTGPAQFLLCKVAVGRSYVMDEKTGNTDLPPGYDSFYVHKNPDADGDGKVSSEEYNVSATHSGRAAALYAHEYHILDPAQVQVQYLVHFTMKPRAAKTTPICIACEKEEAVVYCKADDAHLCEYCDEIMHSANQLVARHVRVPLVDMKSDGTKSKLANLQAKLGAALSNEAKCVIHSRPVEYFCPLCHFPVCVQCKMIGSHSSGDAATHKLIPIADAYETALIESQRTDPILEGRRAAIQEHLQALDAKLLEVNKNSAEVEEQIYQLLQDTLFKLQDETQKKMNVLLGEELELRRQLEQLDWIENFLDNQRDRLPVVDFLECWARHAQLRSVLHGFRYTAPKGLEEIYPDIKLTGNIDIVTLTPAATPSTSNAPSSNSAYKTRQPNWDPAPSADVHGSTALRENLLNSKLLGASSAGMNAYAQMTSPASDNIVASVKRDMRSGNTVNYNTGGAYKMAVGGSGLYYDTDDLSDVSGYTKAMSEYGGQYGGKGDELWTNSLKKHMMGGSVTGASSVVSSLASLDGVVPGNMIPNSSAMNDDESIISDASSTAKKSRFAAYSLKRLAARRKRALSNVVVDRALIFNGSKILTDFSDAEMIYNVLPVKSTGKSSGPAETVLIYSSWEHGRTLSALHSQLESMNLDCPTVVLVKSRAYVFGGYASDYWNETGERFGSTQCFLFSLNHGVKIPYHGRVKDGKSKSGGAEAYAYGYNASNIPTDALCGKRSSIQFGIKDLVIKENLLCSSELEYSYGLGLKTNSKEAMTFLAGSSEFDAELIEIWGVGSGLADAFSARGGGGSYSETSSYRS